MPNSNRWNSREDELVSCSECHNFMMPLRDYNVEQSERPSLGDVELWEFIVWGWAAFVYNYVYDSLTFKSRQAKVEKLHAEILPTFPNSLICPRCLHIKKRP